MAKRDPVGLVGTGLFGSALADRLLAEGYPLVVYNRTRTKAAPLVARGAEWSESPLTDCRRVIFSLFTTEQVEQFIDRSASSDLSGRVLIDTSTSDPEQTSALGRRLHQAGAEYLEAPFSGSSDQARNHSAVALVAGHQVAFAACHDLWDSLAARTFYLGEWGNAAKMKLVTNLVLGLNRAVAAEGLVFAKSIGLKMQDALDVLMESPAYSRTMDAKCPKMVHGDFTPQAKLSQHLKDVRLILAQAARCDAELPFSKLHRELLEQAEMAGLGELDNSAIIRLLAELKPQTC